MKIAIIGSGISGLSIARLMQDKHEAVLFEKQKLPGGLIKCERVNDCLFHKVGGHVFNSRNKKVLDWFWSHFDREKEFVQAKRNAKVFFRNVIIGYPIENYIYCLDKDLVSQIVYDLLELQKKPTYQSFEHISFESFLKATFGSTLYDIYFQPYNKKIWQTDLSTVPIPWLEGKLPMPNIEQIFRSNILREEENNMIHSSFYYPIENGSQFIVNRLKEGLNIRTGKEIAEVVKEKEGFLIENEAFDKIVYCGDIRKIPAYAKQLLAEGGVDVTYLEGLRTNGTSNLFCETDDNDISWLYIPEDFTRAHRIIYTGNFSSTNNRGSRRKTCVVEFSGKVDFEEMKRESQKLPGNLHALSFNYEPNSYVVQDSRTRQEIVAVKKILEAEGIYLLGRFAEWEYYNMDKAIEAAFDLNEKISNVV